MSNVSPFDGHIISPQVSSTIATPTVNRMAAANDLPDAIITADLVDACVPP